MIHIIAMCKKILFCHSLHSNIEILLSISKIFEFASLHHLYLTIGREAMPGLSNLACNKDPGVGSLQQDISQNCSVEIKLFYSSFNELM